MQLPQTHLCCLPWCEPQVGGLYNKLMGKIIKNYVAVVQSPCVGLADRGFLPISGGTTACKQGM